MVEKGVGEYQLKKAEKSRTLIINCLASGDWVRYKDIVNQTGLSTATVSKVLKKLEKEMEIDKKNNIESEEYPHPVTYRLTKKGFDTKNKDAIKKRIDETPLKYSSMDIERQDLKVETETSSIVKIVQKILSKTGKENYKDESLPSETLSIMSNSKLVKEWKAELEQEIYKLLQEKHPEFNPEALSNFTPFFSTSLFANLENAAHLNILSSLEIPTIKKSKYKPISTKYQLGLDAEIYTRLLETVILILKNKYKQSNNLETFLEETKGTSMIITLDLKTDFYRVMEYFENMFSEIGQHLTKG